MLIQLYFKYFYYYCIDKEIHILVLLGYVVLFNMYTNRNLYTHLQSISIILRSPGRTVYSQNISEFVYLSRTPSNCHIRGYNVNMLEMKYVIKHQLAPLISLRHPHRQSPQQHIYLVKHVMIDGIRSIGRHIQSSSLSISLAACVQTKTHTTLVIETNITKNQTTKGKIEYKERTSTGTLLMFTPNTIFNSKIPFPPMVCFPIVDSQLTRHYYLFLT